MKLSDIRGERVFDVIADIIDPIARIAEDKEASKLFKRERLPKGETPAAFMLKRVRASVPTLLRNHKGDLTEIMAALEGKTKQEYANNLTVPKLISDILGLLNDSELLSLFGLAQTTGAPSSGAAQETTTASEA